MSLTGLIPGGAQAKLVAAAVAAAVVFGAGFGLAWKLQGANLNALKENYAEASAKAAVDALHKEQDLQRQVADLDTAYFKELADANAESDRAVAAINTGARQLRIHASCSGSVPKASGAGSVDHGAAGGAVIDRADADRLLAIAATGDRWRVKLRACQSYVTKVIEGNH